MSLLRSAGHVATKTTTKVARETGRSGVKMVVATVLGAVFGWWWDRPPFVKGDAVENPLERRAQWSSAVFWPALALWLAAGLPGCPRILSNLTDAFGADRVPQAVWAVGVTTFACLVLMRRLMAVAGRGWGLGQIVRDTWRWASHYRWLSWAALALIAGLPVFWLTGNRGEAAYGHMIPVAGALFAAALLATRDASEQARLDREWPWVNEVLDVLATARDRVSSMPIKGGKRDEFSVTVPDAAKHKVAEIDGRLAEVRPMYEARAVRSGRVGVFRIEFRRVTPEVEQDRQIRAATGGYVLSLRPAEDPTPGRIDEHIATLKPGVPGNKGGVIDEGLRQFGFRVVEFRPDAAVAHVARLSDDMQSVRDAAVRELGLKDPWDVELRIGARNGLPCRFEVKRAPGLGGTAKRYDFWTQFVTARFPVRPEERWGFSDDAVTAMSTLTRYQDPLINGFTIGDFIRGERAGHDASSWRSFPIARREDGGVLQYGLFHTLVIGQTGAGKGSVIWSILSGLLPAVKAGMCELYFIDPKKAEAAPAPDLFVQIATAPDEWDPMLEALVEQMKARQEDRGSKGLRSTQPSRENPLRVIIVDEMSALKRFDTDSARARRVEQNLLLLISQGRADAYTLIAAVQGPQKDLVGDSREFFALRVALRTGNKTETDLALGDGAADSGADAHKIPPAHEGNGYLTAGIGFMKAEGETGLARIRFPYTDDATLQRWNAEIGPLVTKVPIPIEGEAISEPPQRTTLVKPAAPAPSPFPVDEEPQVRQLDVLEFSLDDLEIESSEAPQPEPDLAWPDCEPVKPVSPTQEDDNPFDDFTDDDFAEPRPMVAQPSVPDEDEFGPLPSVSTAPPVDGDPFGFGD